MGKKEDLIVQLKPLLNDQPNLEKFLMDHSNLPGPRSNLELAFAFAEIYEHPDIPLQWIKITEAQADVNQPRSFLAFCGAVCLGKLYTKTKDQRIIPVLKQLACDGRWRMREAVAFAFQLIGENDFNTLRNIFSGWIKSSNNMEKRAILVSLAHPPFLNEQNAAYALEIAEKVMQTMDMENNFDVLKKGLAFTLSVFAAAHPRAGFDFFKRWLGKDKMIDKIIKENLKKKRLAKADPQQVQQLLTELQ